MVKMVKKRPCRVCRRWFQPHPRAGSRQTVCSQPECQRERHRRASLAWWRRNPDYNSEGRLRERVNRGKSAEGIVDLGCNPMQRLDWDAVQDAVGLEVAVIIEESGKVVGEWVQDAVLPQSLAGRGFPRQLIDSGCQDEIAPRARPP